MKTKMNSWWGTSGFSCSTFSTSKLLALFLVLGFTLCAQNAFAGDPGPASDRGIQPMFESGNPTCSDLIGPIDGLVEYRIDGSELGNMNLGDGDLSVTIDVKPDKTFDWTSSGGVIYSIFVKGGPNGNLYDYESTGFTWDGGLHSPVNENNGNYYGLSHVSFCYVPGEADIEITKTCTGNGPDGAGTALVYGYKLTVENTGDFTLYDIVAVDDTAEAIDGAGSHTYTLEMLEPGEKHDFEGSFTTNDNGFDNHASVKAAVEDGGEKDVEDSGMGICPPQEIPGELSLTKDCDVVVVLNDYGDYGLQVNYSGEICNESAVAITLTSVTDNKDNDGPTVDNYELAPTGSPGACTDYYGSYVPVPGEGELGEGTPGFDVGAFMDTVSASGITAFGLPVDAPDAMATCTLCPQCVDMEMCPAPASAINLE
ncbi:DUF7507 domain-containing protein [Pseudoalteromonas sp. T1lg22]|uniref:DUF7507 domain-containing protein n=1 Tax=Pseudoalteromonas sp. T1lg22 TaxID=2077096 RepID=UPI000CF5E66D|nr:hypothetical protein [Pseudoalteromonas sp. T1lg22]